MLEIGPHKGRLPGFETLDAVKASFVDHVADCRKLPFPAGTFDVVYASHVIEHIEWYDVERTINGWAAALKPGGWLEVHTINGLALMKAMIAYEETGVEPPFPTKWRRELHRDDPHLFIQGRLLNFPKGGSVYQMHRAIITPNYLRQCFERAGLSEIQPLEEFRGTRHPAAINLGLKGQRPC